MILISYGTRPEWIKIKPLLKELDKENIKYKLLFTGQHENIVEQNGLKLKIKDLSENRLDCVLGSIINNDNIFEGVDYVMVHGDTTSALGMAISAFHRKIPVIHLEAGLRTFDFENPYPEEFNRQTIDKISSILLAPTELNKENLILEKVKGEIYVVGNTVLDNIRDIKSSYNNEVLVTLHRRENHELLDEWFKTLSEIATENDDLIFTIPLHPNPNVQKYKEHLKNINIIEPLEYDEMIKKLSECKFIISDSGGIQEEASFLNKKVIVCRKTTERQESINIHSFLCEYPKNLKNIFNKINYNFHIKEKCPYGDGYTSEKITKILNEKSFNNNESI